MPFDLGHDPAGAIPALRSILEARVVDLGALRWSADPAAQQVLDVPLQHRVGLDADGVQNLVLLQVLVDRRHRECSVCPKVDGYILAAVGLHHRLEHRPPLVGTGDVALP